MIDYQEIGNNIKICRIRCNLKQAELAEMVGVTSQHISHVERCQTKPSLTLLVDISTALRVDLYELALELDLGYQGVAAAYHRVCKKVKEATGRDVK